MGPTTSKKARLRGAVADSSFSVTALLFLLHDFPFGHDFHIRFGFSIVSGNRRTNGTDCITRFAPDCPRCLCHRILLLCFDKDAQWVCFLGFHLIFYSPQSRSSAISFIEESRFWLIQLTHPFQSLPTVTRYPPDLHFVTPNKLGLSFGT